MLNDDDNSAVAVAVVSDDGIGDDEYEDDRVDGVFKATKT
jgi:hypothetical protein